MNSGDEATISVFALALSSSSPRLIGRIVDVTQINNIDTGKSKTNPHPGARLNAGLLWTLAVLNGLLGASFVSLLAWFAIQYIRYKLWAKKWEAKAKAIKITVLREVKERLVAERKADAGTIQVDNYETKGDELLALAAAGIPKEPSPAVHTFKDLLQVAGFLIAFGTFSGLTTYVLCIYSIVE